VCTSCALPKIADPAQAREDNPCNAMKTGVARAGRLLLVLTREHFRSVRLPLSVLAVLDFYTDGDSSARRSLNAQHYRKGARMDLKRHAAATLHACVTVVLLTTALLTAGCFLRTPHLLNAANKPPWPGSQPPRKAMADRIKLIVRTHMVDGYVDPWEVGRWLDAMAKDPKPILDLLHGLAEESGGDLTSLYKDFNLAVSPASPTQHSEWGIPPPPLSIENGIVRLGALARPLETEQIVGCELDAERFAANARGIASSLLVLQNTGLDPLDPQWDADLREGIRCGAGLAKDYLQERHWNRRVGRPTTAIVISGGSANGAFSAGFLWRLTEVLQTCKAASGNQSCPHAGIDLAVGTSTGSLIAVMLDVFSTNGQEQRGRDLMRRNYTCSTAAEVYCVNDVWSWQLLQDTRGLVQFDGLRNKLNEMWTNAQRDNAMELVTMAVDLQTGDLLAESDQDTADGHTTSERVDAVLASGSIPVMTDPIERLGGGRAGTFVDGGVRSDAPVMEAFRRGAERVLVIKSSGLDSDPQLRQPHAGKILARTVDLFIDQVAASEIQQASLFATARRLGEHNLCEYRLWAAGRRREFPKREAVEEIREERDRFCKRESLVPHETRGLTREESAVSSAKGAVPAFLGPDLFEQVAQSVRSVWVMRPEGAESATGYQVDSGMMKRLFILGIKTFQARCLDVLRLLDIPESVQKTQCTRDAKDAALKRANAEMEDCVLKAGGVKPCKR
jgi:predicted acylesterase/phospholipase RssA